MNKRKLTIAWGVVALIIVIALLASKNRDQNVIGGERDAEGCLIPAGYAYSESVGACIRSFEMTPDIMKAAQLAVSSVGKGYALTVVSFNSYEEIGSYDINFERGLERTKESVRIKNWQVQR